MSTSVLLETDGAVATLPLNRPARLNTITQQVAQDVRAWLEEAQRDDAIRVIRLKGAGRAFCAGYDIDWGAGSMQEAERDQPWDPMADLAMMSRFVDTYMALWRSPKPVIAQVHGFCVGGGTDFALCSDLIVCAEDCRIGYPPARVGGSPAPRKWSYPLRPGGLQGPVAAGHRLDGRRAVEWGLASECHPDDDL